jgi:hypothetical protein
VSSWSCSVQLPHHSTAVRSPETIGSPNQHSILSCPEVLAEIAADASRAQARLAERGRAMYRSVGVQRGNGLDIALRQASDQVSAQRRAAVSGSMPVIQAECTLLKYAVRLALRTPSSGAVANGLQTAG